MRITRLRTSASAGVAMAVIAAFPVTHGEALAATAEEEVQQLRAEIDAQRKRLEAQQQRLDQLEAQILSRPGLRGRGAAPAAAAAPPAGGGAPASGGQPAVPTGPVGQAPDTSRPPEVPALVDIRGVLTPRKTLILEPSLQYSHSNNNRVVLLGFTVIPAITIGLIDIRNISRDTFIAALAARYGLTNRFEVEAKAPWVYRSDATSVSTGVAGTPDSLFEAQGHGIGDVEFAARYQLNQPGPDRPYYVAGLRLKTRTGKGPLDVPTEQTNATFLGLEKVLPTGSGFYGLQPSLTAIYPSDPAVFFGSVNYLWNIKRDFGPTIGTIDPGDSIGFTAGMGLALNEKASFSIAYDHATVFRTKQNGLTVPNTTNTQLGSLLFGISYRVTPKTTFNFTLGAGLTQDAPNVQLTFRLPMEL